MASVVNNGWLMLMVQSHGGAWSFVFGRGWCWSMSSLSTGGLHRDQDDRASSLAGLWGTLADINVKQQPYRIFWHQHRQTQDHQTSGYATNRMPARSFPLWKYPIIRWAQTRTQNGNQYERNIPQRLVYVGATRRSASHDGAPFQRLGGNDPSFVVFAVVVQRLLVGYSHVEHLITYEQRPKSPRIEFK